VRGTLPGVKKRQPPAASRPRANLQPGQPAPPLCGFSLYLNLRLGRDHPIWKLDGDQFARPELPLELDELPPSGGRGGAVISPTP